MFGIEQYIIQNRGIYKQNAHFINGTLLDTKEEMDNYV